jgi:caffeoyl-CoA O-methyltransferase
MTDHPYLRADVASWLRDLATPTTGTDPILDEMHQLAAERDFPIVGPEVGRLLAQLASLGKAKRVFEMGSGFGYSTLWFARAVGSAGHVWHTDGDAANTACAKDFLGRAGVSERVTFTTGDALEALASSEGEYDIVFCDVDKHQYPAAYDVLKDRVCVGGVVIVDNLVWSGRVAAGEDDPDTAGARDYIRRMWSDHRYLSSLMPVRDGVGVSLRVA